MEKFAAIELKLGKSIRKGTKESLLSLFSAAERFKYFPVLLDAEEDTNMKVVLEGFGKLTSSSVLIWKKGRKRLL